MFEIYNITFSLQATNLLPPSKRSNPFIAWMSCLLYPIQWCRNLMFETYANGDDTIALYNPSTSYVKTNRVRYNNSLYEVVVSPPTSGVNPLNTDYWIIIQADWRGVRERIKYNGQKLILEYLVNRWFGTTFNQPAIGNSAIWIQELVTDGSAFLIGASENDTSLIAAEEIYQIDFIATTYTAQYNDFQVNYPLSLIPSTSSPLYAQLVALVNKYKMYNTNPTYVGY